jgi:hypothetical protein
MKWYLVFSLVCYLQELQHLGNAILRGSNAKD